MNQPAESSPSVRAEPRPKRGPTGTALTMVLLLAVHAGLLAWGAWRHSFTWVEVGLLPAGICNWRLGRFDVYRVTPPLVRMTGTAPLMLVDHKIKCPKIWHDPRVRAEWVAGREMVKANGMRSFWLLTLARWTCIPFSLLGGYVSFRWAGELYGRRAAILALVLWCFSPNMIAHGQLISADAAAASLGALAAYAFWRWLKSPCWSWTLAAGAALGLAELTKTSWIILFPLWPAMWAAWRWRELHSLPSVGHENAPPNGRWAGLRREALQLSTILLLGVYLINLGYGFEGSCTRLGDFRFASTILGGKGSEESDPDWAGNRFANTWLGAVPVPLPKNYVQGIDLQKWDLDRERWSYLRGEWHSRGWWYYYLYALAIKVPLGTWILILAAAVVSGCRLGSKAERRDELFLLAMVTVMLVLVSSQTNLSKHMRYVLPIFPFAFIWTSKAALAVDRKHCYIASIAAAGLLWSVASSLWVYPHSLSYFNELVGGPRHGHEHLVSSNIDWGQDLLYLKRWCQKHPQARPLKVAYYLSLVNPRRAGIEYTWTPVGPDYQPEGETPPDEELGPQPGWYAVSVGQLRHRNGKYAYFLHFEPVDMVGYSIYIYHITSDEANRVRRKLGLCELAAPAAIEPKASPLDSAQHGIDI